MNQNPKEKAASLNLRSKQIFDFFSPDINWKKAFCSYFERIPNTKSILNINIIKVLEWFERTQDSRILKKFRAERYDHRRKASHEETIYILDNECIVCMNNHGLSVDILYSTETPEVQELADSIRKFKQRIGDSYISVVVSEMNGLSLTSLKFKKLKCSIQKNYNDDLFALHEHIVKSLRKKDCSGLTLFHGVPGTGKSTYIKYLIGLVNKKVIFLPPKLAGNLDDPQLTRLITENPDTIIVIEDAETLLVARDSGNSSAISMLLNLTDGLLGSSLGIQFICTFNTLLENIDKALLRKGRLTTLYEFKPLSESKSKNLIKELGIDEFIPSQAMTLAEIYNVNEQEFELPRKLRPVGFTSKVA